jgi:hypothetical protein
MGLPWRFILGERGHGDFCDGVAALGAGTAPPGNW